MSWLTILIRIRVVLMLEVDTFAPFLAVSSGFDKRLKGH